MNKNKKIAVIGYGSWATAIVKVLTENIETVHWWVKKKEIKEYLLKYKHNIKYLQSVEFNLEKLKIYINIEEILSVSDFIIVAIPSAFLNEIVHKIPKHLWEGKILFSAIKGIIPEQHAIPAKYFHENCKIPYKNIGIISGPCHAEEVASERLSYLTLACKTKNLAKLASSMLTCRYIKTTICDDLLGIELSAVLKNIYAIASGICYGLGYGDNFQSVLMSSSIREIQKIIDVVYPLERDVLKSAYLGDLLVTGYSQFSRNRTFGFMIGKGYSVISAQLEMSMIAEGYYAVKSMMEINNESYNIDIPIVKAVHNILYEKIAPNVEIIILAEQLANQNY